MKTYEKIKELREQNNLSIDDVAKILDITSVRMNRIEEGRELVDVRMITILANHYNVKIGDIFKLS
jgi:transcriptional regulator with XRE-family HTH domain